MSLELFSVEQQRRVLLQALIDLEPLPKCTRFTIEEPQSSLCNLVCTFARVRTDKIELHEQVLIADYWHPGHIRQAIAEAVDTLRKRTGWT